MLVFYDPNVEVTADPEWQTLRLGGTFRGHQGKLEMVETFLEAWQEVETLPEVVVDLGGSRLLFLGTWRLVGHGSGIKFEREVAQLVTLRRGLIVREEWRFDWDSGLRAAGLDPETIDLAARTESFQAASGADV